MIRAWVLCRLIGYGAQKHGARWALYDNLSCEYHGNLTKEREDSNLLRRITTAGSQNNQQQSGQLAALRPWRGEDVFHGPFVGADAVVVRVAGFSHLASSQRKANQATCTSNAVESEPIGRVLGGTHCASRLLTIC